MSRTARQPLPGLDAPSNVTDELKSKLAAVGAGQGFTSRQPVAPAREPIKMRPLHVEISETLFRQIKRIAAERDVTNRFVVVEALRQAGFDVTDDEMFEDGRKRGRVGG